MQELHARGGGGDGERREVRGEHMVERGCERERGVAVTCMRAMGAAEGMRLNGGSVHARAVEAEAMAMVTMLQTLILLKW